MGLRGVFTEEFAAVFVMDALPLILESRFGVKG